MKRFNIGEISYEDGCFTEEFFIKGMTSNEIGEELGLPTRRLTKGMYIAYAEIPPKIEQFELGGWTKYSSKNFMDYKKKKNQWNRERYEEIFRGKRMPITIAQAKQGWLSNMSKHKLVKSIPVIPHSDMDIYPEGRRASQLIVINPIRCEIVKYLKPEDVFIGVWR